MPSAMSCCWTRSSRRSQTPCFAQRIKSCAASHHGPNSAGILRHFAPFWCRQKIAEIGWKPLHILNNVSASVGSVIKPAGFENAQDIISAAYLKDVSDPQWDKDAGMKEFLDFLAKDFPEGNKLDGSVVVGYGVAQTLVKVLKQCGDNLTRENIMKQAANLKDFRTEVLLPGIKINTSPTDFAPISQLQLMKFKGDKWELFGDIVSGDVGG